MSKVKLGEIAKITKLAGFEFTKYINYNDTGEIIALRALNLRNGRLDLADIKRIDREVSESLLRSKLYINDILLTYTGNGYGDCAIIEENDKYHLAPNICKLTPDVNKVNPYYLYTVIRNPSFRMLMSNYVTGSGQPTIPMKTIRILEIELPDRELQDKIADFIRNIDDKIVINGKINDNLLQQARTLYQAWFVDYTPFNGVRPSDWIDDTIDGLAKEVICGKTPSTKVSEYYGNDIPFITIPDMHGNTYAVTTERYLSLYGAQSQPKKTLPRNSICVSCIGTAGLVTLTAQESQTNQQINSIIPKEGYSPYYIYLLMEPLSVIINNLGQSGSPIVNLNKAQFGKIAVVIPSIEIMKSFDEIVSPMFESILSNQEENIKLAELRDSLLPRLMSGELDVSELDI